MDSQTVTRLHLVPLPRGRRDHERQRGPITRVRHDCCCHPVDLRGDGGGGVHEGRRDGHEDAACNRAAGGVRARQRGLGAGQDRERRRARGHQRPCFAVWRSGTRVLGLEFWAGGFQVLGFGV